MPRRAQSSAVERGTRSRVAASAAVITSAAVSGWWAVESIGWGSCSCEVGGAIAVTDLDWPVPATDFGADKEAKPMPPVHVAAATRPPQLPTLGLPVVLARP